MTFEQLRGLCLALPEVEERETWGDTTFRIRDKIFVIGSPGGTGASIKASLDDQAGLLAMDPETFSKSAYVGRFGWVRVELERLPPELGQRLIRNAWRLTAPKRVVAKLEEAP